LLRSLAAILKRTRNAPRGDSALLNDTWIWNGANWTQVFPPMSPPARRFDGDGMAYDPATKKVVLFGGNTQNGTFLGDTWTWDGVAQTWTQMFPATSPSARAGHGMATDAAGNVAKDASKS